MKKETKVITAIVIGVGVAAEVVGRAAGLSILPIVGIAAAVGGISAGGYTLIKNAKENKDKK